MHGIIVHIYVYIMNQSFFGSFSLGGRCILTVHRGFMIMCAAIISLDASNTE